MSQLVMMYGSIIKIEYEKFCMLFDYVISYEKKAFNIKFDEGFKIFLMERV